jgi:hypothetical protein
MIDMVFPGVGLISGMAKSKQKFGGGRSYSAIAHSYTYDNMVTEMEICLAKADEESCLYAADQVRAIFRNVPGVSVEVQQVGEMKIVIPPNPNFDYSWLASIFTA